MNFVVAKKYFFGILVIVILSASCITLFPISAQEEESPESAGINIKRMVICSSVVEREPVGEAESFSVDIKKVFCFTDVRDAGAETFITHEWYYKDELKATVKLKVAGEHWRTWSSKAIDKNWAGQWRVEIKDVNGNLLKSLKFAIGEELKSDDSESGEDADDTETDNTEVESDDK